MDKSAVYRKAVIELLNDFAQAGQPIPGIETQVISDVANDRFQLVTAGWLHEKKFTHIVDLHLDIKNGKIRVWKNGLDIRIADELAERGIDKKDVILAFQLQNRLKMAADFAEAA